MSLSPVTVACISDRYDCGHITRSALRPVKRAVFLYRAEAEGLGYLGGRHEDAHTLAALALMRQGAECDSVLRAAATPDDIRSDIADAIDALEASLPTLTPRQVEVLALVSEGYSFPEIATALSIATETVRSLSKAAMRATATHSVVDAAVAAAADGLL